MSKLFEGLQAGDLNYLVGNKIHFDEYDSKMGDAADVITMSFKVTEHMPSEDLVNFLENGYEWILDADVSTGEIGNRQRLVFVEMPRKLNMFNNIMEMLTDLDHLTGIKPTDWKFKWYKGNDYFPLTKEELEKVVPHNRDGYRQSLKEYENVSVETDKVKEELETIKRLSGIK